MLDVRTLLLATPEDRYAPTPMLRRAEILLFPLVVKTWRVRSDDQAARPEEVMT
jgi:hypothetical protein